ncbi:hypothetical protein IHE45_20G066000 [Dioscorea alata]|uniref:Uncharacterized protein n=1 Tax=Dioscorea alata TaxID=55571 RepID=A0ACB7TW38_DIOAL|nr:hypothetical protein IHE45_20G066000 [Dioscorea alata]
MNGGGYKMKSMEMMQGKESNESNVKFQMPLHYPKYTKEEYESMPEKVLDRLLSEYGLPVTGDVAEKRKLAVTSFLWPHCSHFSSYADK